MSPLFILSLILLLGLGAVCYGVAAIGKELKGLGDDPDEVGTSNVEREKHHGE